MVLQKRSPAKILDLATISNADLITQDNVNYLIVNQTKIDRVNIISVIIDINENELTNNILLKVDDGTSIIPVMIFDPQSFDKTIKIGDFVLIIGKVRDFNKSRYIAAEIVKKTTKKWFIYRKKLIEKIKTEVSKKEENNKNKNIDKQKTEEQKIIKNEHDEFKKESNTEKVNINNNEEEEILVDEVVLKDGELSEEKSVSKNNQIKKDEKEINKDKLVYDLIKELDEGDGADLDKVIMKSKIDDCEEIIRKLLREGEIYEVRPNKFKVL